jgi:tetratricopeptide (TPR) repeat protein
VVLGLTLAQYAYFCTHLGWYERAKAALQHSLALLHRTTDPVALADMLTFLCYLQFRQGEYQLAIRSARESLDLNRRLDNPAGLVLCLIILSCIHLAQGDFEQVITISGESLSISRSLGDPHGIADSLITLSTAARQVGKHAQARLWSADARLAGQTIPSDRRVDSLAARFNPLRTR